MGRRGEREKIIREDFEGLQKMIKCAHIPCKVKGALKPFLSHLLELF